MSRNAPRVSVAQKEVLSGLTYLWSRAPAGASSRTLKALKNRNLIEHRVSPGVSRKAAFSRHMGLAIFPNEWRLPSPYRTHRLATWAPHYQHIVDRVKTFELRRNDRDFRVGDVLELYEFDPGLETETGRACRVLVKGILKDAPQFGLQAGFCIMSLSEPWLDFTMDPQWISK